MRVEKIGKFNPKRTLTRDIQSLCRSSLLFLDRLLIYTEKHQPDIYAKFILKLTNKYKSEIKKAYNIKETLNLEPIESKVKRILSYQDLVDVSVDFVLSLLQISGDYKWEPNELTVLHMNVDQAVLNPEIDKIFLELEAQNVDPEEFFNELRKRMV